MSKNNPGLTDVFNPAGFIFNMPNPIPWTITDQDELTNTFKKYDIIPYYGWNDTTSHAFLSLLQTLTSLSPTFCAAKKDMTTFTFGQQVEISARTRPGLNMEVPELSQEQQLVYNDYLTGLGLDMGKILRLLRRIDNHLEVCGNAYIHLKRITVGDTVQYRIKAPHYKHVAYLKSEEDIRDFIIISKFLGDEQWMQKHPPKILPATKEGQSILFVTTGAGIEEAIIHVKKQNDNDESDFYARPDIISVMTWLYVDFQTGNLSSKVSATELISKKLLAFQAPDPNTIPEDDPEDPQELGSNGKIGGKRLSMFQQNMMVLKNLSTNLGGHPSILGPGQGAASFAGVEYPFSGVAPTEIDLEVNRDTKHQTWQLDTASTMICAALSWSPELIMIRQTKTQLGGNLLHDIFTLKNESVIKPRQSFFEDLINWILADVVTRESGPSEFVQYGIKLPDVISEMIVNLKGSSGTNAMADQVEDPQTPAADGNDPDPDPDVTE